MAQKRVRTRVLEELTAFMDALLKVQFTQMAEQQPNISPSLF
jgi:hypothetical protein